MSIRSWMKKRIQELPTGEYVCKVTTLDSINAFDVLEPVLRCRDCAFYAPDPDPIDPGWPMWCERYEIEMVGPDGFCAWGEPRGDA